MTKDAIKRPQVPAAVYLVADHLDAVLAAGEDLLALFHRCDGAAVRADATLVRRFADEVRTLEMTIAARCLQARARAAEVRAADLRYKPLIDLFIAGTAALQDAVADMADSTTVDFHGGGCSIAYLRSRGVIPAEAPGLHRFDDTAPSEAFLIAERIRLGVLMDLCATFLDRLEDHYELYVDIAQRGAHAAIGDIPERTATAEIVPASA